MRRFPLLAFVPLLATAALADPPPGTIMKAPPPKLAQACAANIEVQATNLKHLETALALDAKQKPLFDAWRNLRLDIARAWPCPKPPTGLNVPTPQRLENQIAMMKLTLEGLRKEQPPAMALYNALTPQQRAIFDGPAPANPQ